MHKKKNQSEMLKIFNRNIPIEEIKKAFSKTVGTNRETLLYRRFFKEC